MSLKTYQRDHSHWANLSYRKVIAKVGSRGGERRDRRVRFECRKKTTGCQTNALTDPSTWRNCGHTWLLLVKHFYSIFLRDFEVNTDNVWSSRRNIIVGSIIRYNILEIFVNIFRIMCLVDKFELSSNLTILRFWLRYLEDARVIWWKHDLRLVSIIFYLWSILFKKNTKL